MTDISYTWHPASLLDISFPPDLIESMEKWVNTLPLFQQVQEWREETHTWLKDIPAIQKHYNHVVVMGTGGSSLGGQTLAALSSQETPKLHFLENIDPYTFSHLFSKLPLKETYFLVISKSGQTAETLLQFLSCIEICEAQGCFDPSAFCIITEPQSSALRTLAQHYAMTCYDHPPIGGRYSCFSLVGLLPAALLGIDVTALIAGAQETLLEAKQNWKEAPPLQGAAHIAHHHKKGRTLSVMMPYCDRLLPFAKWYAQLWAESLGKEGRGSTPVAALGTVDQHSQLQLFLEGPADKVVTLITLARGDNVPTIPAEKLTHFPEPLPLFSGKTLGDLMVAEQEATRQTLIHHGVPVREIHLNELTPFALGELLMHFMLETLAMACFLEVNPFDQPAVEHGKKLTFDALRSA